MILLSAQISKGIVVMNKSAGIIASAPIRLFSLVVAVALILGLAACPAEESSPDNLVMELLFEENLADSSKPQQTATPNVSIAFVPGKHGKCASFDGQSWIDTGFPKHELGAQFTV